MQENLENTELAPSHKKRNWGRLIKGVAYITILALIMAGILYSPLFVLNGLIVRGNKRLSEEELMDIARLSYGQKLFHLRTDEVTHNLLKDLRIESAIVRRQFPNKLELDIVERQAVATIACDFGYIDFDRQGKVIAGYKIFRGESIPLITGAMLRDLYIGDDNNNANVSKVLAFLTGIDYELISQLAEINISSLDNIVAYTNSGLPIRLGGLSTLEEKAILTQDFLTDLKTTKHSIEYVDFRYKAPVIKLKNVKMLDPLKPEVSHHKAEPT